MCTEKNQVHYDRDCNADIGGCGGGGKARKRTWSQTVGYRLSCLEGCAILRKCSIKLVVYSITVAKSYRGIRQNWGNQNGVKNAMW